MVNENCIFHFKSQDQKDSFLPEEDIYQILYAVDSKKLKAKSTILEIDKDLYIELGNSIKKDEITAEHIVIDIFNNLNPSALDSIFNILFTVLNNNHQNLKSIIIIGSGINLNNLQSISKILLPFCTENQIGVIVINKDGTHIILEQGNLPLKLKLPTLQSLSIKSSDILPNPDSFDLDFIKKNLEEHTKFLYGHFHIKFDHVDFHTNGILSIYKCLEIEKFITNFRSYTASLFKNESFKVKTYCIKDSGVEELAKFIVKNDSDVLNSSEENNNFQDFNLLILTDFISNSYKFKTVITQLKKKHKTKKIIIVGISKYRNYLHSKDHWLIQSDFSEFAVQKNVCSYCNHDSKAIKGDNFTSLRKSISEFDTYSFWELIKLANSDNAESFSIKHYPSTRTRNHFDFRIICEEIFKKYAYTIANRLINLAEKTGIKSFWIHKMLFTTDKELIPLIEELSEILYIKGEFKIHIEREYIDTISADNPGEKVEEMFMKIKAEIKKNDKLLVGWNTKNNTLIIDQAAHNFKTLSALVSVCKKYNLTLMAVILFINRADAMSTKLFIENKFHLLSLYNWPVKAHRFNSCFCLPPE